MCAKLDVYLRVCWAKKHSIGSVSHSHLTASRAHLSSGSRIHNPQAIWCSVAYSVSPNYKDIKDMSKAKRDTILTMSLRCRSYSLPVKDQGGRKWEFVIKSWANGTENRRVYVLEQTGEFLKVPTCVPQPALCLLCNIDWLVKWILSYIQVNVYSVKRSQTQEQYQEHRAPACTGQLPADAVAA